MQQCAYIFILFMILTAIQTIFSFDEIPSSSYYSLLPSRKQMNIPECLSKNRLLNMLNRNRRASISRPYFQYWRPARDNGRYSTKNFLAFSPRLGKRAYEDENQLENIDNKFQYRSIGTFLDYLQENNIDIIDEDSTKICFSQPISDAFIQQILDKIQRYRRDEETNEPPPIRKHPVLFRYRLG